MPAQEEDRYYTLVYSWNAALLIRIFFQKKKKKKVASPTCVCGGFESLYLLFLCHIFSSSSESQDNIPLSVHTTNLFLTQANLLISIGVYLRMSASESVRQLYESEPFVAYKRRLHTASSRKIE